MADTNQNPQAAQGQDALKVNIPSEVQKGVYSNAVSVNVNSNEVVVDFGYLVPNTATPVIEVVSRVNMNHRTAESFLGVLAGAMEDFKKKQQEAAAQAAAPQAAAPAPAPSFPSEPMPAPAPAPMPAPAPAAPIPPFPENA
jgi:hypothetical protein